MNGPDSGNPIDPKAAEDSLKTIDQLSERASQQGRYTRACALAYALWGGALSATVALPIWPLLLIAGLVANHAHRNRTSAWIQEVPDRRSLRVTLGLGLSLGALFIVSYSARADLGEPWISWTIGAVIAIVLYSVSDLVHGASWDTRTH